MKQGKQIGFLGSLSVLCNPMIASALRSHEGKGNSRKPFSETNKIHDYHRSSASWQRGKEQLDTEGIKTVGGRNSHFELQLLGDTCTQMI